MPVLFLKSGKVGCVSHAVAVPAPEFEGGRGQDMPFDDSLRLWSLYVFFHMVDLYM